MRVEANGIELEYDEMGSGDPLILIMGLGTSMMYWPPGFCELLVGRGFRVIMFDNRDCGRSSRIGLRHRLRASKAPRRRPRRRSIAPYGLEDMAADTAGLMDALGLDDAHILGASMGGMIAQKFAINYPDRTRSLTSIMSTTGDLRTLIPHPKMLRALISAPPIGREAFIRQQIHFFSVCGSTAFRMDDAMMRTIAGRAYDHGVQVRGFLRQLLAVLTSRSRREALGAVLAPTLVVHGSADPYVRPLGGRATARAIPGARFELIEGMGHDLPANVWPAIVNGLDALRCAARREGDARVITRGLGETHDAP